MKHFSERIASQIPHKQIAKNTSFPELPTMNSLNGKVALVTGGSKGIGRATSLALAKAGASVVINYSSDATAAEELVKQIGTKHAYALKADAGSVQGAEQMVKATIDHFGKLDILIPNAGKYHFGG